MSPMCSRPWLFIKVNNESYSLSGNTLPHKASVWYNALNTLRARMTMVIGNRFHMNRFHMNRLVPLLISPYKRFAEVKETNPTPIKQVRGFLVCF